METCRNISIVCERMEGETAAGNPIDLDVYGTLTDRLGRCFHRLGLKQQPREIVSDPFTYAREHLSP
jgi:hypothetical protein